MHVRTASRFVSPALINRVFVSPVLARRALAAALVACVAVAQAASVPPLANGAQARVTLLETTDIHSNVLSYDYYKARPDPTLGLERTATLIERARKTFPNTFLFDDGDTIQGSVLADYQAQAHPVGCGEELAVYRAMDTLGYDGGTIGNHEFNYGLPFLAQVTGTPMDVAGNDRQHCAGPHYPLVLANVDSARDGRPIFKPWTIVGKTIVARDPDGRDVRVPLRIAILGFAPPPIMEWDHQHLAGKVVVSGVVEAARRYLPQIEAQHPDLVVALIHGGLDTAPYAPTMENAAWYLAGVPGIDVLLMGHVHTDFPGPHYQGMQDVDATRGFVRGVPAVMGGFFGKDLGLVQLALVREHGHWMIDKAATHSAVWPTCQPPAGNAKGAPACVPADPAIAPLVAKAQAAAIAYVDTPIGKTDIRLSSYFADEGNPTAIGVVNAAQLDYVKRMLPRVDPALANVPVLSAASAFRTGFGGPDDYTDVPPGVLTLRSAADLYFYPNTLAAVKIDGAGLKAWLEHAAGRFARIDPATTGEQALIDPRFVGYNFDQIQATGLHYAIDVSKPVGQRIVALTWQGKPVQPRQAFMVATNNYRANGGGDFPGLDGKNVVLTSPDGTREIVAAWLKAHPAVSMADLPPRSWNFAPLAAPGPIVFTAAAGKADVAHAAGLDDIRQLRDDHDGTAVYAIDLGK